MSPASILNENILMLRTGESRDITKSGSGEAKSRPQGSMCRSPDIRAQLLDDYLDQVCPASVGMAEQGMQDTSRNAGHKAIADLDCVHKFIQITPY